MEDFCGFDMLGAETIPTVGADYTDAKTVTAVQAALIKKGYDVGDTGPNNDGVDGILGPKTKAAIKKVQAVVGEDQNGKIDTGVIMALQVTPGVLPPGVTMAGRAAVQAQVALDAATQAEHATTPAEVQQAAQQAVDAAPASPPELKQAAQKALVKAHAATTPAQVQAAAQDVKAAAQDVHAAVSSWWTMPAWAGGMPRWKVAAIAGGGVVGLGALFALIVSGGTTAVVAAVTAPVKALLPTSDKKRKRR